MKRIDTEKIGSLKQLLKNNRKISIIPHINPDGDAIGSSLALAQYLTKLNKSVKVIVPNDYPDYLHWIPGQEKVVVFFKQKYTAEELLRNADLIFYVDFNDEHRCGEIAKITSQLSVPKVLIDHHPNPGDFASVVISDTSACATAELVYEVIDALGDNELIDLPIAESLFAAILTDTGSFSYNSSQPRTFEIVGDLLKRGIDKDRIYSDTFDKYSGNRMKLLGYALSEKMVHLPEYRTAFISLTKEELERYHFVPGDTEGFVNNPLAINDVVFTALFMEKDGRIKISFRSKGKFATNLFSGHHFNGGGHANASGGESHLTMEETLKKFEALLPDYKEELLGSM
ncbi:bifunctional oligoribonuclease/PAP phosphatase NrnA [Prolixibacteraceae bacterium JC049]|nr:bifunctional oligoribonuclease/PAP phosphatase NrnA [Prolixibacteraceae bacterium JC049]